MNLQRLGLVFLILMTVSSSCDRTPEPNATEVQPAHRTIEVIVQDPELAEVDFTGVVLRVGLVEDYVEVIPKVELDTGANMRVESCQAAAADPALAELRCFVTERDRWRSLGEMLAVELAPDGTVSVMLPDPDGRYSIWIDDMHDGSGCGYSGKRRVPAHRDDVVMNLEAWCE